MVCGYGRHGKDTVCEMLGLDFKSSSEVANEAVIWPLWGINHYATPEDCFNDRHQHRDWWHRMISKFCTPDKTRLGRIILEICDTYCGIRCRYEFLALKRAGLFDLSIWVDASERHPPEPTSSCTMTRDLCDLVLTNNGSLDDLAAQVGLLKIIINLLKFIPDMSEQIVDYLSGEYLDNE